MLILLIAFMLVMAILSVYVSLRNGEITSIDAAVVIGTVIAFCFCTIEFFQTNRGQWFIAIALLLGFLIWKSAKIHVPLVKARMRKLEAKRHASSRTNDGA